MKTRPEMTDDEIRSYMDFDRLLEMHSKSSVHRDSKTKYIAILGVAVGISIFSWMVLSEQKDASKQKPTGTPENKVERPLANKEAVPVTDTVANALPSDVSRERKTTEAESVLQKLAEGSRLTRSVKKTIPKDSISGRAAEPRNSGKPVVNLVYVQAAPVHGYPDLYEYFNRELKYPQEAMKDSIQGEVIAVFTINANGLPEKIAIENSLGLAFDKEVLRLVRNMPPWKPATYNSKPVASKMSLPLTFQIRKISSPK